MLSIEQNNLVIYHHGRSIVLDTIDYAKRRAALLAAGYRLAVARIVADHPLTLEDARVLAVEIGLVKG
jgi:hypothetical protein